MQGIVRGITLAESGTATEGPMKKTPENMLLEIKENMRGGDGQVEMLHLFTQNELRGRCRIFARLTLQPGCSIGEHAHNH